MECNDLLSNLSLNRTFMSIERFKSILYFTVHTFIQMIQAQRFDQIQELFNLSNKICIKD